METQAFAFDFAFDIDGGIITSSDFRPLVHMRKESSFLAGKPCKGSLYRIAAVENATCER
jgi:hypothetical protein